VCGQYPRISEFSSVQRCPRPAAVPCSKFKIVFFGAHFSFRAGMLTNLHFEKLKSTARTPSKRSLRKD